jgi:putative ABC transport system substrate-binding protein
MLPLASWLKAPDAIDQLKRRDLITLLGGAAAAWPLTARAQPAAPMRRIGVLTALAENDRGWRRNFAGFIAGLREAGWIEGQNFRFESRYVPGGSVDDLRAAATELVALRPDVIVAMTSVAARLVAEQTQSIPIVFLLSIDPVAERLIASVSRPGGNITGFTQSDYDLGGKWVQLLKEIAPGITAAAFIPSPLSPLVSPSTQGSRAVGYMSSVEDAARSMGIPLSVLDVRNPNEIEEKISGLKPHQGVIVPPNSFIAAHRARIIELLTRSRVPAIYFAHFFVSDGGLISYGIDQPNLFRQGGGYVDRILRGTNPADLPAQSPTKFELVINLKTAKALGLDVPPALLARADAVIE